MRTTTTHHRPRTLTLPLILTILLITLLHISSCRMTEDLTAPPFTLTHTSVDPTTHHLELGFDNPNDTAITIDLEFYLSADMSGAAAAAATREIPPLTTDHRVTLDLSQLPDPDRTHWYRLRAVRALTPGAEPTAWQTTAPASTQPLTCTTARRLSYPASTFDSMQFGTSLDYTPGTSGEPCSGRLAVGTWNNMAMYEFTFDDADTHSSLFVIEHGAEGWQFTEIPDPVSDLSRHEDLATLVRIDQDTLLMASPHLTTASGDPSPSVHIFSWDGTAWTHVQTLQTTATGTSRAFGFDIADGVVMIGSPGEMVEGSAQAGTVRVYTYSETSGEWEVAQELTSAAGPAGSDRFGYDLRMDGGRVVVGSVGCGLQVFADDGSGTWTHEGTLEPSDSDLDSGWYQQSGFAISGDRVVAGDAEAAYGSFSDGAAIVFTFAGTAWGESQVIPNAADDSDFGASVALWGELLAVGAENSVRLYRLVDDAWEEWSDLSPLQADAAGSGFGSALSLHTEGLFIGAPQLTIGTDAQAGGVYMTSVR